MSPTDKAHPPNVTGTIIDARGLICPMPVLKLEKHLDCAQSPLPVTLYADDPVARIDIPVLCNARKLVCTITNIDAAFRFQIAEKAD